MSEHNPLLTRLNNMPGETIRLPSLGRFYKNGELTEDCIEGEILLKPMTMTDEIMMKSPDMLFQGTAIEHVLQRCSPNLPSPLDLLSSDVDYILTQLRRISYGPTIEIPFVCQNEECNHEQEVVIPLDYFITSSKEIDPAEFDAKFVVTTKSDNRRVQLKPITFRDYIKMQQVNPDALSQPNVLEDYVLESYSSVIQSVDDIFDRNLIKEWLAHLPRRDTKLIMDSVHHLQDWGPTFNYKAKCNKCSHVNELSTELNPTAFFIRPSSQETLD